ncbi:MAG: LrgB family protein [Faecalibacterium sp.]
MLNEFLKNSTMWGVGLTLAAFGVGTVINRVTKKAIFNPLLLGSLLVIAVLAALRIPYADYKASASLINWLLLPATVSLAVPLYEKWGLLRRNAKAILAGIAAGTLVSMGCVLAMALLLGLDHAQYVTLLPKSVTTAISMDVSSELGGIASLTGTVVILTGIVGNLCAEAVCKRCGITDPIARGVAIGTSAHAIGTSKALEMGDTEGAMSGLSIAVAGILTAVLSPLLAGLL